MTLVTRDPWQLMQQWQNEMDRVFHSPITRDDSANVVGGEWIPAVDIKEEEDRYLLTADIPGVSPDEIEVSMENGMLSVKGERKQETKEERENYKRIERSYGTFYRRFSLPDNTDPEHISATGRNGVLEVVIPKVEAQQPRKIKVDS